MFEGESDSSSVGLPDRVISSVRVSVSESVCVNERVTSSDQSIVNDWVPFENVSSNEYVHAMVRVQVIVYVNDVDTSRVFEMGTR